MALFSTIVTMKDWDFGRFNHIFLKFIGKIIIVCRQLQYHFQEGISTLSTMHIQSFSAICNKSRSCAGRRNRGLGVLPNKHETADPAPADCLRFPHCGAHNALLAGYCPSNKCPQITNDSILKGKRESATMKQL